MFNRSPRLALGGTVFMGALVDYAFELRPGAKGRARYWLGDRTALNPFTLVYDIDGAGLQGGENLDVGDVNADGYDDIVVGRAVDGYDSDLDNPYVKGGRVTWIPGTPEGPDGVKAVFLNQDRPGVPGTAQGRAKVSMFLI